MVNHIKMQKNAEPTIQEISKEALAIIQPLILELNPTLSPAQFDAYLQQMQAQAYRCVGIFEEGALVGAAGFWIFTRFWCGKQCDIDNVIVSKTYRNRGYASKLLAYIEAIATREACDTLVLDSYASAANAHHFYFKNGYFIKGFHFIKPLTDIPATRR